MIEEPETELRQYFKTSNVPPLPSNFGWMVMQRVYATKVVSAQRRAHIEALLIGIGTLLTAALILTGYFLYTGGDIRPIPKVYSLVWAVSIVLFLLSILDIGLNRSGRIP